MMPQQYAVKHVAALTYYIEEQQGFRARVIPTVLGFDKDLSILIDKDGLSYCWNILMPVLVDPACDLERLKKEVSVIMESFSAFDRLQVLKIAQYFTGHKFTVRIMEPSHDGAIHVMAISKGDYDYHWTISRFELEQTAYVDMFKLRADRIMWEIDQAVEKKAKENGPM